MRAAKAKIKKLFFGNSSLPCGRCLSPISAFLISDDNKIICSRCGFQTNWLRALALLSPAVLDKTAVADVEREGADAAQATKVTLRKSFGMWQFGLLGLAILWLRYVSIPFAPNLMALSRSSPAAVLVNSVLQLIGGYLVFLVLNRLLSKTAISLRPNGLDVRKSSLLSSKAQHFSGRDIENIAVSKIFAGRFLNQEFFKFELTVHTRDLRSFDLYCTKDLQEALILERRIERFFGITDNPALDYYEASEAERIRAPHVSSLSWLSVCPQCRNSVSLLSIEQQAFLSCPHCGARFKIHPERTQQWLLQLNKSHQQLNSTVRVERCGTEMRIEYPVSRRLSLTSLLGGSLNRTTLSIKDGVLTVSNSGQLPSNQSRIRVDDIQGIAIEKFLFRPWGEVYQQQRSKLFVVARMKNQTKVSLLEVLTEAEAVEIEHHLEEHLGLPDDPLQDIAVDGDKWRLA